ncbi:uncharacterized protein PFLUO_LOCUS4483 [Penicillium psychrofluorescens]|uniref:uncharacterized protein n=1 Tax=Penicillium psychrofluorescens TaxID=3158075 RepID=UPI003CCDB58C
MKENIWYWAVHHGCRVHILSPKVGNGTHRKVILSGSEHVLELVSERIDRVQSLQASRDPRVDIFTPRIPLVASTEALRRRNLPVPVPRGVWDIKRAAKKPKPLDKVLAARPSLSTVREFTEYMEDLTHATEPSQKANRDPSIPYQEQIAQEIVVLFREDSIRKCLSTAALNRALIFLCDHQRLRRARVVFSIAEHVATADTYNILLRSAAQHQHLHVFKWLLLSMWRVHIRPNPDTWLALLEALVNPHEKAALMTQMAQLGYLKDTSTIRRALQLTVQNSLLVHLESGQSIDVFINSMVTTHGTNWFSPSLLRDMFSVIARLRDFDSAERLLQICTQHNLLVDSSSLAEIVYMCRRDIFSALYFTKLFLERPSFRLSSRTWERLFLVAFKGRHYNICRVLWRYACMNKAVSHNMKRAVLSSLSRNVSMKRKDLLTNCFLRRAGKVIIGVPGNNKRATFKESTLNDLPSEFHANPISYFRRGFLAEWEERSRQLRLAKALVARDIDLGASLYRPKQPLNLMLDAAAIMDREWRDKLHGLRGLTFLLDHVIEVPVWRYGLTKSKRVNKARREGAHAEYPVLIT